MKYRPVRKPREYEDAFDHEVKSSPWPFVAIAVFVIAVVWAIFA